MTTQTTNTQVQVIEAAKPVRMGLSKESAEAKTRQYLAANKA